MLIPDLYRLISEYVDSETYALLKSLGIPVCKFKMKFELLLSFDYIDEKEIIKYQKLGFKFNTSINNTFYPIYNSKVEIEITSLEDLIKLEQQFAGITIRGDQITIHDPDHDY